MKLRFVAAAAVAGLSMVACSSPGETPSTSGSPGDGEGKKVTVWMYPVIGDEAKSKQFWTDTEKSFEQANEGIDLNVELQPWAGRDEKIATAIAGGKGPDLALVTPDSLPGYVANGGLLSLKDAQDPAFLPSAVTAATIEDEIYAVPLYHTVVTTAYNKKAFADAGVALPKTWDDVKAAAPKLAAEGVAVMDYSGKTPLNMTYYPLLWQAGGKVFAEDGKSVAFNSAEGKSALQFLVDLNAAKGLPADAATKENAVEGSGLTTGKIAMTYAAVKGDVPIMEKALGAGAVQVGEPLKGAEQVTFGLPGLLARTSIGKDDQSVNAVARYLSSAEVATKLSDASGYFPARSDAKADASDPLNAPFEAALKMATAGEVHPQSRQVMAALTTHLQAALQGTKSVDQALADAEKECNDLIAQG